MAFYDHFFSHPGSVPGLWIVRRQNENLFSSVRAHLPESPVRLLEIGVGKGDFAVICRHHGIEYHGIEPNIGQAEKLKGDGFAITSTLVPPVPFETHAFDVVYCAHLLEHMESLTRVQQLVVEVGRVLEPRGLFALVSPNFNDWRREFYDDYTHSYPTTPRRVSQLFSNNGFEILQIVLFNAFFFGKARLLVKYLNRLYPWQFFDTCLGRFFHKDFFFNIKPTFNENFLIIGRKLD